MGTGSRINQPIDSLNKRYFFKLTSSIIKIPVNFLIASIVPRGLGLNAYGNFSYITDFFTRLLGFLNFGTITAFYTKLSKDQRNTNILRFYWGFMIFKIILSISIVSLVFLFDQDENLWIDQTPLHIWLGLCWGILYWYDQIISKVMDAFGLTVKAELALINKSIVGLLILLVMYFYNQFSLTTFFCYSFLMFLYTIFLWWRILNQNKIKLFPKDLIGSENIKSLISEFTVYSNPLFIGGLFSLVVGFFDRWLLQFYSGSGEQGLYSLAYKISGICFLFTNAMSPLFTRELSIEHGKKSIKKMKKLFIKYVPIFFFISATLGIFFLFNAETIVKIIGGKEFSSAVSAVALMSIYPIHQTYGQLNASVYFASERTVIYRNIGIFSNVLGLFLTIIFLSPNSTFGFGLGAIGLSFKMVIAQIIGANISLFYNSKYLKFSFFRMFIHQIFSITLILLSMQTARFISNSITSNLIFSIFVSGVIYFIILFILIYIFPDLISSSRTEINRTITSFKKTALSSIKK